MLASTFSAPLVGVLLLAARRASCAVPTTFSITAELDYNKLRGCGKTCMWESNQYWVGGQLGCGPPYANDCMCRTDLATVISSHATSCLNHLCTGGVVNNDINTFLSIYDSYCYKNGYTLPGALVQVPKTTEVVVTVGSPTAPTITRITVATITVPASSGSDRAATNALCKWFTFGVAAWMAWGSL